MPQHLYADAVKFLLATLARETRDPGIELSATNHIAAINKFEASQASYLDVKIADQRTEDDAKQQPLDAPPVSPVSPVSDQPVPVPPKTPGKVE